MIMSASIIADRSPQIIVPSATKPQRAVGRVTANLCRWERAERLRPLDKLRLTGHRPALFIVVFCLVPFVAFAVGNVSTIDSGGQRVTGGSYTIDGSVGGIGGISSATSPPETMKHGYIGQLTEVVSLTATGTPVQVDEGATSQLTGLATLDDTTVTTLTGSDIAWGFVMYPFQSVSSGGLLTAVANVYASPVGTINGYYLGATSNASVQVLGPYANAGIADSWLVQYFGMPPNPNAAPTADADGTGQNNLFKYVAGLDPTNPASVFMLLIQNVTGQPNQKNLLFNPVAGGRTYTPQFRTDMVTSAWATLTGFSGPTTNINQVTLTDLSATQPQKFYRIDISLP
jgi:hypothetical protein